MGELLSLLTALVWAVALVLFKRSGESIPPFALNLFRVAISSLLFSVTLVFVPIVAPIAWNDVAILAASGLIGIAISDTLFHRTLNLLGASATVIVDCLYSPFVALLAMGLLGESLTGRQWSGMALVLAAVLIVSGGARAREVSRRNIAMGVVFGVGAMLTVSLGVVMVKPVLARVDLVWATAIRQFFALGALSAFAIVSKMRGEHFSVFRFGKHWRVALPATFLGSYAALMLWLAGMKFARAGVAAVLNQTSVIWVLMLAALFLGEKFTSRKLLATAVALGGVILMM